MFPPLFYGLLALLFTGIYYFNIVIVATSFWCMVTLNDLKGALNKMYYYFNIYIYIYNIFIQNNIFSCNFGLKYAISWQVL